MAIALVLGGTSCQTASSNASSQPLSKQPIAERATTDTNRPLQGEPAAARPTTSASDSADVAPARQLPAAEMNWSLSSPWGALPVAVYVPQRRADQRLGALIAYHGRGETLKGPARGVRGWFTDYRLLSAVERLHQPPLSATDFQDFISAERLTEFNSKLQQQPYADIVLVTPYLPDVLKKEQAFANGPKLGEFVSQTLIPKMNAELPLNGRIGLDGVSLGGRAALLIGLTQANRFVSLGALQAAIDEEELQAFTELAQQAQRANPRLRLRLLTSDRDYYQQVNRELSESWTRAGVPHRFDVVQGTHSYEFNRGPGAFEMLLFHSRLLAN